MGRPLSSFVLKRFAAGKIINTLGVDSESHTYHESCILRALRSKEAVFTQVEHVTFPTNRTPLPFCRKIMTWRYPHVWGPDESPEESSASNDGLLRSRGRMLFAAAEVHLGALFFSLDLWKQSPIGGLWAWACQQSGPTVDAEMSPVFGAETPEQVCVWGTQGPPPPHAFHLGIFFLRKGPRFTAQSRCWGASLHIASLPKNLSQGIFKQSLDLCTRTSHSGEELFFGKHPMNRGLGEIIRPLSSFGNLKDFPPHAGLWVAHPYLGAFAERMEGEAVGGTWLIPPLRFSFVSATTQFAVTTSAHFPANLSALSLSFYLMHFCIFPRPHELFSCKWQRLPPIN